MRKHSSDWLSLEERHRFLGELADIHDHLAGGADLDAAWVSTLHRLVGALPAALRAHYQAEEESDLYTTIPREDGRLSKALFRLVAEHDQILSMTEELSDAASGDEASPKLCGRLALQAQVLIATIQRHEAEEREILIRAAWRELGED